MCVPARMHVRVHVRVRVCVCARACVCVCVCVPAVPDVPAVPGVPGAPVCVAWSVWAPSHHMAPEYPQEVDFGQFGPPATTWLQNGPRRSILVNLGPQPPHGPRILPGSRFWLIWAPSHHMAPEYPQEVDFEQFGVPATTWPQNGPRSSILASLGSSHHVQL